MIFHYSLYRLKYFIIVSLFIDRFFFFCQHSLKLFVWTKKNYFYQKIQNMLFYLYPKDNNDLLLLVNSPVAGWQHSSNLHASSLSTLVHSMFHTLSPWLIGLCIRVVVFLGHSFFLWSLSIILHFSNTSSAVYNRYCLILYLCTHFQHHKRKRYTWKNPGDIRWFQINYILVRERFKNQVKDRMLKLFRGRYR